MTPYPYNVLSLNPVQMILEDLTNEYFSLYTFLVRKNKSDLYNTRLQYVSRRRRWVTVRVTSAITTFYSSWT